MIRILVRGGHVNGHFRYRINTPNVVSDVIDGEVVIVNLESGSYYSLRKVGASLWKLIEAGASIDEAASVLAAASGGSESDVVAAVAPVVDDLLSEGLVVIATELDSVGALPSVEHTGGFEAPRLERYDEMQEMLLYDPIHDVDETGWPNLPESIDQATVDSPKP